MKKLHYERIKQLIIIFRLVSSLLVLTTQCFIHSKYFQDRFIDHFFFLRLFQNLLSEYLTNAPKTNSTVEPITKMMKTKNRIITTLTTANSTTWSNILAPLVLKLTTSYLSSW